MSNPWFDPSAAVTGAHSADLLSDADAVRLAAKQVHPHFQPIVDLLGGTVIGYEVLSRALRFPNIVDAFSLARRNGLSWELEAACRQAAISQIGAFSERGRGASFFLNVSPEVLGDPRFLDTFGELSLRERGIDSRHIVLELTEQQSVADHGRFGELIQGYAAQGFQIAIDDFGVGHSNLITLVSCSPHFLKLDTELVRRIETDPYRQRLVRSLVGFAQNLDSKLVAEGVETWQELEVLVRLGVRFAQGFLFARPEMFLQTLSPERRADVRRLMHREDAWHGELTESIGELVVGAPAARQRTLTRSELEARYSREPDLDEVVLLDDDSRPVGLLTRQHFFSYLQTREAADRPQAFVDEVAKPNFMVVEPTTPVTSLSRLTMERGREALYDPVIVVGEEGRYAGAVTIRQLLMRSAELEEKAAEGENPLTRLPGNRAVLCWITNCLARQDFTIVYADLDRLKDFNDVYGFVAGDELIRVAARVLTRGIAELGDQARIGHLGGDDFVLVCTAACSASVLEWICSEFDREKRRLFRRDDLERGAFIANDRQGNQVLVPLVTLSLAAIDGSKFGPDAHPALFFQIAHSLKKKVKEESANQHRSVVLFERRRYPETPPPVSRSRP